MTVYLIGWIVCCLAALALYAREARAYAPSHRSYWRYLAAPWKLATFAIAALGITFIAPYTGDPTWDYFDAAMMAVLTFVTAPWSVATLYLCTRRKLPMRHAFVAACAWLFAASWCYDAYLLWRDGYYPVTWSANLVASSILYMAAGLFWNLHWREGRGVTFGFLEPGWPQPPAAGAFRRIVWIGLPFMVLAAILILQFVVACRIEP